MGGGRKFKGVLRGLGVQQRRNHVLKGVWWAHNAKQGLCSYRDLQEAGGAWLGQRSVRSYLPHPPAPLGTA